MEQEVTAFIQKKQLLTRGATVMVGVSGGPDSMALLHYLCEKRATWDLHLIAVSVDHQLRGRQSREDVLYVENMCKEWDVDFVSGAVDVKAYKKRTHEGTQQACRVLRYQFFEEQMKKHQANFLALAHHGDDQVETLLMRLTRVADAQQFSGIPLTRPFAGGMIIRPFLCVTREQIDAYLAKHGIVPRLDPSNLETDYTRNYFRRYVVPLLRKKNSNIHHTQQHLNETLHEDEVFLEEEARKMAKRVITFSQTSHAVSFEITAFQSYPTALQRRVYHLILNYLYQRLPKKLTYMHEENFFALLKGTNGTTRIDFPNGLKIERSYGKVVCYFSAQHPAENYPYTYILTIPGQTILPDGSAIIADYVDDWQPGDDQTYIFASDDVAFPLIARTRQAGDRMSWKGLAGSKKIKDIFIDAKVPLASRQTWPLIADNDGKILWLIGLKKANHEKISAKRAFIRLRYKKKTSGGK